MQICGLQKTTLLDYPEHLAATVFTGGCNLRCPFCHNRDLVLHPDRLPCLSEKEVLDYLEKRKGILEGVCITGGEPTLQQELVPFLLKVREMGFLVKLDTNGYLPDVLEYVLKERLVDYVAMDVKASLENYGRATGYPKIDTMRIRKSITLLKHSQIPYEFRTTVVKGIHSVTEFEQISELLQGCPVYYLQAYKDSSTLLEGKWGAFSKEEMREIAERAKKFIDQVVLRGVD